MILANSENADLITKSLQGQKRLREKLRAVDATNLEQEDLADYTFCVNKNFLAIKRIETQEIDILIAKMRENENEIKNGIENLKEIIDKINEQVSIFNFIDRIIAITVRIARIFTP